MYRTTDINALSHFTLQLERISDVLPVYF